MSGIWSHYRDTDGPGILFFGIVRGKVRVRGRGRKGVFYLAVSQSFYGKVILVPCNEERVRFDRSVRLVSSVNVDGAASRCDRVPASSSRHSAVRRLLNVPAASVRGETGWRGSSR